MIREEATPLPGSSQSRTGVKDEPRAIAVQGASAPNTAGREVSKE